MPVVIPVFQLEHIAAEAHETPDFFVANAHTFRLPTNRPYRSQYYGIGICTAGGATLRANLHEYAVLPNSLIVMGPSVVKQWSNHTTEYDSLSFFFTRSFIAGNNPDGHFPDQLPFFSASGRAVTELNETNAALIISFLQQINHYLQQPHPYRAEIIRHYAHVLLYEMAAVYAQQPAMPPARQSRKAELVWQFQQRLTLDNAEHRAVSHYANALAVSPKYLSETVREITGKTAGDWIDEAVMLEARVRLQDASLSVAQIADQLHFADASAFGKFFRKHAGLPPGEYRNHIEPPF
jgi:AraC family transcriptional regulator, transcriptional activator of pobA